MERWTTSDGGGHWRHRVVVTGGAGVDNVRPLVPRGSDGGPMGLLWMRGHYGFWRGYRTEIAFLNSPLRQ
jgi:hypothetical protein